MNKKGNIGTLIIFFIGVIVALSLLPAIAENQAVLTDTQTASNVTYTMAASGSFIDLNGQEYISGVLVTNSSSGTIIDSNYTIGEGISASTGLKTVTLTSDGAYFEDDALDGLSVNVSYVYGPDGYADSSGARSMAKLIILMAGLGILGFAVFYSLGAMKDIM